MAATNQQDRPTDVPFLRVILGGRLRRIREDKSLTREQLGEALGVSAAVVRRLEMGENQIRTGHVIAMGALFELPKETVEMLKEMAKQSKTRGWWTAYGSNLHPSYSALVEAEQMARDIRNWEPSIIPGLLQTSAYTEAAMARARFLWKNDNPLTLEELVESRDRRKALLTAKNAPKAWFVIGESALRMQVGDGKVMREATLHLIEMCEQDNVTIQILTEASGYHVGAAGSCAVYAFSDQPGDGVVYHEQSLSFSDDPETLTRHIRQFELLASQALSLADTRSYLQASLTN
ncbi:transcriptional regulator with XRE-family HTH domain [Kitasatospora sp. MAP12-15]|uniref:helix-turn-helix domain-containing protein n=1 Tax=unclassified Kitasatospora TaxID=2633591 RepID=UPI002473F468|nr:helix-turn-helix transcriptional regulator [Kitasatospora sp. MAP12-44]MDH6111390.1 transcriptional regulator with XRE-family HTH domain [Kitasatospora sp. MAP12-44]